MTPQLTSDNLTNPSPQDDRDKLLDAAENLFYARGYQAVGMDTLRAASQLSLKRIYSLYSSKDSIAIAMLDRRDTQWRASLAQRVDREAEPKARVLAIFDWLANWLGTKGHRGCAWINAFGELGGTTPAIVDAVRQHKSLLRGYIHGLTVETGASETTANAIYLLFEGSLVTGGFTGSTHPATQARTAAALLLTT
jgi:AcrR family transcriptional regulator